MMGAGKPLCSGQIECGETVDPASNSVQRTVQVAVFIDFENLVIGAEESLPGRANPVPYSAIETVCQPYGNAAVRRAYADWARSRFNRYQQDLALNGVDLIHVTRFGTQQKNAADIRMAVDAMELLITHPDVEVFILVAGDGDYSPLVQRLREFGKRVVGVGTEATASKRLVSVCSEYKYWATLVAQVDPRARVAVAAEFDIAAATRLLVSTLQKSPQPVLAAVLKNKMLTADPSFDERNYGCSSFRELLSRHGEVVTTTKAQYDLEVSLKIDGAPPRHINDGAEISTAVPSLLDKLRNGGADMPDRPETRDSLLGSVHDAWRTGRLQQVSDIGDVLLDDETGYVPNKVMRLNLRQALVYPDTAVIPLAEQPEPDGRPLRQCAVAAYDHGLPCAEWVRNAHVAWLTWVMYRLRDHQELDRLMIETFFANADDYGTELISEARTVLAKRIAD
jgi:uncharacterized protein (TIGR00288 family)